MLAEELAIVRAEREQALQRLELLERVCANLREQSKQSLRALNSSEGSTCSSQKLTQALQFAGDSLLLCRYQSRGEQAARQELAILSQDERELESSLGREKRRRDSLESRNSQLKRQILAISRVCEQKLVEDMVSYRVSQQGLCGRN